MVRNFEGADKHCSSYHLHSCGTFCNFFSWAKTRMNSLCFTVRVQCLRHTKNLTYVDNHDKPCYPTRSCLAMHKEPSFIANADEWFGNMDESSIQLWKTVIVALQSLLQTPQNGKGVTIHLFMISLSFFMSQKCSFLRRRKSDINTLDNSKERLLLLHTSSSEMKPVPFSDDTCAILNS